MQARTQLLADARLRGPCRPGGAAVRHRHRGGVPGPRAAPERARRPLPFPQGGPGDLTQAREHQERALALDPAHSGAMNELGRIRLRRHDTAGAIRHFISAARATPDERIYSRNIDVVLLRTVSRTIYVFTLIALILIWIPAVTHVDRLPFVIGLAALAVATVGCFAWMVLRLPREARLMVRRTLRAPRVAAAFAMAVGGVAVAFGIVAFTPAADLAQVLPVAVVVTVVARLAAFAALRGAAKKPLWGSDGVWLGYVVAFAPAQRPAR